MLTACLLLIALTTCCKEILGLENDTSMEKLEKEFIYILNYDLVHVNCVPVLKENQILTPLLSQMLMPTVRCREVTKIHNCLLPPELKS